MDPQSRSSVPDVSTLAPDRHLKDLRVTLVLVAACSQLKGDFPFFGQGGKGGQKASSFQLVLCWKRECSFPVKFAIVGFLILVLNQKVFDEPVDRGIPSAGREYLDILKFRRLGVSGGENFVPPDVDVVDHL